MLGPHLPPPPHGLNEDRPTPFRIPDGSYRCLALEAEESSSEEGLQGESGLMNLQEDRVANRNRDNSACRATQGAPELPNALGTQRPACSREAREGPQRDSRASQDWDAAKAQQAMTASLSPRTGPRVAQKPGKFTSVFWTARAHWGPPGAPDHTSP